MEPSASLNRFQEHESANGALEARICRIDMFRSRRHLEHDHDAGKTSLEGSERPGARKKKHILIQYCVLHAQALRQELEVGRFRHTCTRLERQTRLSSHGMQDSELSLDVASRNMQVWGGVLF